MAEMVSFGSESGLVAIVKALDTLRHLLDDGVVTPQQAAGYIACINLHLAQAIGVSGVLGDHIEQCAGLLCPACQGYVGQINNLSGRCHHCGAQVFPPTSETSGT